MNDSGQLPDLVRQAWPERQGLVSVAWVDFSGLVHQAEARQPALMDDGSFRLALPDEVGPDPTTPRPGTLLFLTRAIKAYQIKGTLHPTLLATAESRVATPGWELRPQSVFSGAERLA